MVAVSVRGSEGVEIGLDGAPLGLESRGVARLRKRGSI
jgi:hypothetical protein